MEKGHARIGSLKEHLRQLTPQQLDRKFHSYMPSAVFRLVTFDGDDYEKGQATVFCFNFVPETFLVECPLHQDMQVVLQEVAELNPGLGWERVEAKGEIDEIKRTKTHVFRIAKVPPREGVNEAGEKTRLTSLDIQYVHKTLQQLAFQLGALGMFSRGNPITPCFRSCKGIVFIYGNEHFGVIHINERHGWFTDVSEWRREPSGRQFLDSPSKFAQTAIPVYDYTRIADDVYKPENKVKSKDDETFDKYTGTSDYAGENAMKFHLLLYKGTKIVHTMYPHSKKLNRIKKNILIFKRGKLKVEEKPFRGLLVAKLPYYDTNRIVRYVIIVRLNNNTGCRQIWVETTTPKGNSMFCTKVQETFENPRMDGSQLFQGLEYADFSWIERWIKDFDTDMQSKMK